MKKIAHENKSEIAKLNEGTEKLTGPLNNFIQKFNSLPPDNKMIIQSDEDLTNALRNAKNHYLTFIKSLISDTDEIGLPVNKELRMKSITLPDLSEVTELAANINFLNSYNLPIDKLFKVKDNGVVVNEKGKQEVLNGEHYRTFTANEAQEKFIEHQKAFVKSFEDFRDFSRKTFGSNNANPLFDYQTFDINKFASIHGGINGLLMKWCFGQYEVKN